MAPSVSSRPGAPPAALAPPPSQTLDLTSLGFDEGSADAPIRVVEFSDFGCGYCRRFHEETYPAIVDEYISRGYVQWKYVTYVSGMFPNGMEAAFSAECVGEQGDFRPIRDRLFGTQREWKSFSGSEAEAFFRGLALEVGADGARYDACLDEGRRRERVRRGILAGGRIGVRGTPTFLVDGYPVMGAQPLDFFRAALNVRLQELGVDIP